MAKTSLVASLVVLAPVFGLTACGSDELGPEFGGSMEEQRAELLRRPSMEEAGARYQQMHTEIRDRLAATFPWLRWEQTSELRHAGCSDFENFTYTGKSQSLGVWRAYGNLPDTDWPRAQQIVADISGKYGFTPPETVVSCPSDHQIVGSDQYGASYRFGTAKNTVINGSTGCHLPQAEKERQARLQQRDG